MSSRVLVVEPTRQGEWVLLGPSPMPLSEHHTADEAVEAAKAAAHDTDAIIYVRDRYGRCRPVRRAAKGRFATTK